MSKDNKAGFTPGPWYFEDDEITPYIRCDDPSIRSDICDLYHTNERLSEHFRKDNATANGCLIAAAPDMYEALKAYDKHFGLLEDNHMMNEEARRCTKIGKAAIAKAEGRETEKAG